MKATGITRRIDDLGRIVIPKEIRRTLRVREGDPLEIFTDREGMIILKKYSPIGEMGEFADSYVEVMAQTLQATICITDTDSVIAASGAGWKELMDQPVSKTLENSMESRSMVKDRAFFSGYEKQILIPILSAGDVIGSVLLLKNDGLVSDADLKVIQAAAGFIGRHMENV